MAVARREQEPHRQESQEETEEDSSSERRWSRQSEEMRNSEAQPEDLQMHSETLPQTGETRSTEVPEEAVPVTMRPLETEDGQYTEEEEGQVQE